MARLLLSKATLSHERKQLASYQRFLPSLDMKRQQLRLALKHCEQAREQCLSALEQKKQDVATAIPMLADPAITLNQLVTITQVVMGEKRLAGVPVPTVENVDLTFTPWPLLAKPHWIDALQRALSEMVTTQLHADMYLLQIERVHVALRKVTQRVNLFDKVLIPQTQSNIKRIQIFLDDRAREAVITSKIAKKRHSVNAVSKASEDHIDKAQP